MKDIDDHDVSSSADINSDTGTCTTCVITPWPNVAAAATSTLVGISVDSTDFQPPRLMFHLLLQLFLLLPPAKTLLPLLPLEGPLSTTSRSWRWWSETTFFVFVFAEASHLFLL